MTDVAAPAIARLGVDKLGLPIAAIAGIGATDFSKELLKDRSSGDTHHVHLSYKDGTYDGRYVFVNDKASARLARVDIESMEVDKIAAIPNSQGTHGIFPQRHKTGYVFCNAEFRTPQPNDGSGLDALLWIKLPGESDGTCNGGPAAGASEIRDLRSGTVLRAGGK